MQLTALVANFARTAPSVRDTLLVITESRGRDVDSWVTLLVAPILVALMALVSSYQLTKSADKATKAQRDIADAATKNQQQIAEDATKTQIEVTERATEAQRKIAEESIVAQIEVARKNKVVESRREWMNSLRDAVSQFQASAAHYYWLRDQPLGKAERGEIVRELRRQGTFISLLMNPMEPEQEAVIHNVEAVFLWAPYSKGEYPPFEEGEPPAKTRSRSKRSFAHAVTDLDRSVQSLLEEAWQKIKKGE